MDEQKVVPFLPAADVWPRDRFDQPRMNAYQQLAQQGTIRIRKITYSEADRKVVIEYWATVPQEWVHEELKRLTVYPPDQQLSFL